MTTALAVSVDVVVQWQPISPELWAADSSLYAYLDPYTSEILYLGIAWDCTVRQRWNRSAKFDLWDWIESQGVTAHALIVGQFVLRPENRLSRKLAFDVESLLIRKLRPPGNIQCVRSRLARPGLRVMCDGYWPHRKSQFNDTG